MPLAVGAVLVLLAILHGHATGCPACGRWWAKAQIEKRLVSREGLDEVGLPVEVLLDRTTYQCGACGHRWSVTETQEDRGSCHGRPQRHGG
jgi:hypothetical protein